jgi:hypothetical protein
VQFILRRALEARARDTNFQVHTTVAGTEERGETKAKTVEEAKKKTVEL